MDRRTGYRRAFQAVLLMGAALAYASPIQKNDRPAFVARPVSHAKVAAAVGDFMSRTGLGNDTIIASDGGNRRKLQSCSGYTSRVESSLYSSMEGCYTAFDGGDGIAHYYSSQYVSTNGGLGGVIIDSNPSGTESWWFAGYVEATGDLTVYCFSDEASIYEKDPAWIFYWQCEESDGSFIYASDSEFDVYCGCEDDQTVVSPTPEPVSPTPEPVSPTPEPISPTPEPLSPTPEPASPTPEPVSPTPEPVSPTPEPVSSSPVEDSPVSPTPVEENSQSSACGLVCLSTWPAAGATGAMAVLVTALAGAW